MRNLAEHPSRSMGFLSRYHDRELGADERLAFERHVADCPECAAAVAEYEAILALYRETGTEPADAALATRISRRIDTELRRRPPVKFLALEIDLLWATVAAIGLVAAIALFAVLGRRPAPAVVAENGRAMFRPEPPATGKDAPEPPVASGAGEPAAPPGTSADRAFAPEPESRSASNPRDAMNRPGTVPGGAAGTVEGGVPGGSEVGVTAAEPVVPAAPEPLASNAPVPGALAKSAPRAADETPSEGDAENAAPTLIRRIEPVFSGVVRKSLVTSPVVVEAVISAEGAVVSTRIVRSNPAADRAVLEAVRQWRYRPAAVDGKPHEARVTITFRGE